MRGKGIPHPACLTLISVILVCLWSSARGRQGCSAFLPWSEPSACISSFLSFLFFFSPSREDQVQGLTHAGQVLRRELHYLLQHGFLAQEFKE